MITVLPVWIIRTQYEGCRGVLAQMARWRSVQRYLNIVYKLQTVHLYSTYSTYSTHCT